MNANLTICQVNPVGRPIASRTFAGTGGPSGQDESVRTLPRKILKFNLVPDVIVFLLRDESGGTLFLSTGGEVVRREIV